MLKQLKQQFKQQPEMEQVMSMLLTDQRAQLVTGLTGSVRSLFASVLAETLERQIIYVAHNLFQAQQVHESLRAFLPEQQVKLYPADDFVATDMSIASPELKAQRLETLAFMQTDQPGIVVVPISAIRKRMTPVQQWRSSQQTFEVGGEMELAVFHQKMIETGYTMVDKVSLQGEYSVRGGIIDVFPMTESHPLRLELFDTDIDSIRSFDIDSQRSLETKERFTLLPAKEWVLTAGDRDYLTKQVQKELKKAVKKVKNEADQLHLIERVETDLMQLTEGQIPTDVVKYNAYFYAEPASLLDYAATDSILVLDEMARLQETDEQLRQEEINWLLDGISRSEIMPQTTIHQPLATVLKQAEGPRIYLSLFQKTMGNYRVYQSTNFVYKQMQQFHGQMPAVQTEMASWQNNEMAVVVVAPSAERIAKIKGTFSDYELETQLLDENATLVRGKIQLVTGQLNEGFELPLAHLAVVTDAELFGHKTKVAPRRQKMSNAERIKDYSELKVGDYVVHVNHGVGRYVGMETLEIKGIHKDYLLIIYRGEDKLYIPVEQLELVQKYVGSEGKTPKVNKLGGAEWQRVTARVKKSVIDIADDLIKLYAKREAEKGFAYSPDDALMREFEAAFPYEATEDQQRSVKEIKRDMETARPMDRLLVGDVGYGKTEVALRAAFKAMMDGKQVAILVPTTILAQQHYDTMVSRFANFPINVGLLSRFRTKKQQEETIAGLGSGKIDIVVGTHRLLSKDVAYRDLGLLIVDEEQRFGVTHKEKLKQLRANVDVLTLTATPIPRTLHMSMVGVRDLSVIETPPANRFPIQTYVVEQNDFLIKEAIERELARSGQVYYLHNRVDSIVQKADRIQALVPHARVGYAHGQMNENELESTILRFLENEFDVLVTTTIIETGVDIPNVNTLLIENADHMGLSQLYQLRGRVGRSNRIAYAYFMHEKNKVLREEAEKRLQAIKEFTELGSGFKIAMRDLSIRGAGNILGAQQHGFIDSVGFDMYSQMLSDAIKERMPKVGEGEINEQTVEIDLPLDAYLPDYYIEDSRQKIEMYKRFRQITTPHDLMQLQDDMMDRFGEYPQQVNDLFAVAEMKLNAEKVGIESIKMTKKVITMLLTVEATQLIDGAKVFKALDMLGRQSGVGMEADRLVITYRLPGLDPSQWLPVLNRFITQMTQTTKTQ
ncbi:transcription-repair coupling factor [Brochothrix campestris]